MALEYDDYVWPNPPAWLPAPLRRVLADLTYDEAHGLLLGLVGLGAGAAVAIGGWLAVIAGVGTLLVLAAAVEDVPIGGTFVTRVLQRNVWYFLVSYSLFGVLGAAAVVLI